jgi:hypothetical protein
MKSNTSEKKLYAFNIKVSHQVYQFLLFHFGASYKMSFRDYLGHYIYGLFQTQISYPSKEIDVSSMTEDYTLIMTDWNIYGLGINSLSEYKMHRFNQFIIEMFNDRMVDYVASMEEEGIDNKVAILKWCSKYNLDKGSQDWYAALKKNYYRKKKKYKKSSCYLSPNKRAKKITLAS